MSRLRGTRPSCVAPLTSNRRLWDDIGNRRKLYAQSGTRRDLVFWTNFSKQQSWARRGGMCRAILGHGTPCRDVPSSVFCVYAQSDVQKVRPKHSGRSFLQSSVVTVPMENIVQQLHARLCCQKSVSTCSAPVELATSLKISSSDRARPRGHSKIHCVPC